MAKQSHIVLRQVLELNLQPERREDYHHLSEELSSLGQTVLPTMLDRVLSDLVPPDVYVRFDRLELNVEIEDWSDLKADLNRQLPDLIRKAVQEQLKGKLRRGEALATKTDAVVPDAAIGPVDWLSHFLTAGYLPWNSPSDLPATALWSLYLQQVQATGGREILTEKLRKTMVQDMRALKRFLNQFGSKAAWHFLILLESRWQEWRGQLPKRYQQLLQDTQQTDALLFWNCLLSNPHFSWQQQLEQFLATPTSAEPPEGQLEAEKKVSGNPIFVKDAGMVLLHPFLSPFLQELGLLKHKELTAPAKAAAILHCLIWGKAPEAEWQLVLPKLLLGLPLEIPLTCQDVSEKEVAAGEELLGQVIRHWAALGNTSVSGFRESFLQREGRLQQFAEDWRLVVSQQPYDMLLERLPWNLSIIKLPWMPQPLRVQWV